jgi:uncharacterized protein (DUF433 family)
LRNSFGTRVYNADPMDAIRTDPETMGGKPCFAGTRVPLKNLFDFLARGRSIDQFLEQFPSVSREQVLEVLRLASDRVVPAPAA